MLFILPIRTNIRPWRTPYANYAIITVNVLIFLAMPWLFGDSVESFRRLMLVPARPGLRQFVTYAFLHGGFGHVAGNMFFLYVFGNNVNDRLGHVRYIFFYLAGAVFSGIGHTVLHSSSVVPTLGASGAVAAVTGAYLVLFPQTLITVFYWLLYFIDTIEIPALYFIGFKLIFWDNMMERRIPNVAYDAHLSGYAFGILLMLVLLGTGKMRGTNFDLWAMIKRWNRRRQYRDAVSDGYDPFTGQARAKKVNVKEVTDPAEQRKRKKIKQLRQEIGERIAQHNVAAAAHIYPELLALDSNQILPRQYLLDIANQLASDKRPIESASAYEQFLNAYGNYEHIEQIQLMLGILYSRYLDRPDLAQKHLTAAAKKLSDPGQVKMCKDELAKLQD